MKNLIVLVACSIALAGCGGSSTDGEEHEQSFEELVEQSIALSSDLNDVEDFEMDAPTSGSGTYIGFAVYYEEQASDDGDILTYGALGSFTATADFGSATAVTGTLDDFYEISNPNDEEELEGFESAGAVEGSFDLVLDTRTDSGIFDGLSGTLSGSLNKLSGETVSYTGDGAVNADAGFFGENNTAEYIDVRGQQDIDDETGAFIRAIGFDETATTTGTNSGR